MNVQIACVWALLDVMLRFREDAKLVEQVRHSVGSRV